MSNAEPREAQLGIEESEKEELAKSLQRLYGERIALANQIRACQWNSEGKRAPELKQILIAAAPESMIGNKESNQSRGNPIVQSLESPNEIAERISVLGRSLPASYEELRENSRLEIAQSIDPERNAEQLTRSSELFIQTGREVIETARTAQDEVTVQIVVDQIRPAEQLATQLKRF